MKVKLSNFLRRLLLSLVIPLSFIQATQAQDQNIVQIAQANENFSILVEAVIKADLVDALSDDDGQLTVFAPTNDAFVALLNATEGVNSLDDLTEEQVEDILLYHVIGGTVLAGDLSDGLIAETLNGEDVKFTLGGEFPKVNESNIIDTDIIASNGVIHVIDAVLTPPQSIVEIALANEDFSILVEAVIKADLVDALSEEEDDDDDDDDEEEDELTVFAPTNAAFQALLGDATIDDISVEDLTNILLYHIIEGKTYASELSDGLMVETLNEDEITFTINETEVKVNMSNIVMTDIIASNGVIHVIDAVLTPPQNIVEIALSNPDFSTLVDAVVKADLVGALSDEEVEYTVFAPTNAAFEALLGDATLDDVSVEDLTDILLYHVLSGTILAGDLTDGLIATTLNGDDVKFTLGGEFPMINESNIILTDIKANNGVIHVIDVVLTPPQNIVEIASGLEDFSILVEAVVKAGLVDALSSDDDLTVFAPTNDAFVALLEATAGVSSLDDISVEELTDILLYHVLAGTTYAADLSDGLMVTTLNGDDVKFTINEMGAKINDSNIIDTDIIASNGVIHVIDMVLSPPKNIVEIALSNPDFSILVEAVVKAGLVDALSGDDALTVFAPTNDAFVALLEATEGVSSLDDLSVEQITDILLYHVLPGTTLAADLSDGLIATTLNGNDVKFSIDDMGAKINDSNIIDTDIMATNGVIHVIDMVLIPPMNIVEIASSNPDFSILVEAVVKAGLVDALSGDDDLTVFAPTNDAFVKLLEATEGVSSLDDLSVEQITDILLYHVLAGTTYAADLSDGLIVTTLNGSDARFTINEMGAKINDSNIVDTDIIASNGVIHVIDMVLSPPMNIVEIASSNPDFSILVEAVVKADLVHALAGDDDLTVFAPTNDAFVKLLEATEGVSSLDDLSVEQITDILLYHVLAGTTYAADLSDGLIVTTLNGSDARFTINEMGAKINDSNIIDTDIIASNGVIHVIDMVLSPPMNIVEIASSNPDFSILVEAVVKADLVHALAGDDDLTVFAPTNDAFVKLLEATEGVSSLDDLSVEQITNILLYHVLAGTTYAADLSDGLIVTTLNGSDARFTINEMGAKINDSNIIDTDIIASNGVIHVIDMVLNPPMNIVEIASSNPDFSILVEAVVKADLVHALAGDDDLTVFAPTNDAFIKLLEATEGVSSLDDLSVEQITDILLYHVIGGTVYSNQLEDGQMAETLNGRLVTFTVNDEGIKVNDSNIAPADIIASNGVIHVIDAVLLPPADKVMSFTLIDAETNEPLFDIMEGMEINLADIKTRRFNIRANVSPKEVGSVAFELNGRRGRVENVVPYALLGDIAGNYFGGKLNPGEYSVTATPYSKRRARGEAGTPLTVNFTVVNAVGGVTGFTLVDAITNEDITPILDGDVIHLTTLINIRADLNIPSEDIQWVKFSLNDKENHRVERVFPYALFGDIGGDYFEWKPAPGKYTITATPKLKGNAEASPLTITIEIVDKTVGSNVDNSGDENIGRKIASEGLLQDVSIYPNPAVEQLNLAIKAVEGGNLKIMILDMSGRVFLQENMDARENMNNYQLNVGSLQRGIYLLSIESNKFGKELFRFIKN